MDNPDILQQLDGQLVLRRARAEDAGRLSEFNARIHGDNEDEGRRVGVVTRDLLEGRNPNVSARDFTLVEDTATGKIISSMCLLSQTWTYAGIPFRVGQPEFVGTDPEYRNRRLVQLQFEVVHGWSRERGELMQGITGIPNFYRQYGYEMAVQLDGWQAGYTPQVPPALAEGESEPFRMRAVEEADLPFILECYQYGCQRLLMAGERNLEELRYEVFGRSAESIPRSEYRMIERAVDGERVGYLAHLPWLIPQGIGMTHYELKPGVSWLEPSLSVLRYLWQTGQELGQRSGKPCQMFTLFLGDEHPAYQVAQRRLPRKPRAYSWFIRIPDLKAFLRRITPALEKRLENSICVGHTGDLTIGFYRGQGVSLKLEHGKITAIEDYRHTPVDWPPALMPEMVFWQILLGYRTLEEMELCYTDVIADDVARALMTVLFPRQSSQITPMV